LHGLGWLVVDFLINTPARRPDREPENFLTFLRVSGSDRNPDINFPVKSGPMRLFSRRCLASESGLCLSALHLNPG
jgi:hypothetical protein